MSNHTYGVSIRGEYRDVSNTLRGAKCYATRHGFSEIFIRFNCGHTVALRAEKTGKKWVNTY